MEYSKKQKMLDAMIVGVAIFVLGTLDYDNLRTMDYIYLVSFGFWIVTGGCYEGSFFRHRRHVNRDE